MMEQAIKYRKMGLSVIPLRPSGKEPILPSWKEYQTRLPSEAEIVKWWTENPTANVGIVTGKISGIVVVDLDGEAGERWATTTQIVSPMTVISGKGRHLYFKWTEGIRNSASKLAENVDIRGEGGYVLAPPSIHPNGLRYRLSGRLAPQDLPSCPTEILKPIQTETGLSEVTKTDSWIAEALKEMKHGNIDTTLHRICSRLRADGYSRLDALTLLEPHAKRVGAEEGHLEEKIDNAWARYEPNKPANRLTEEVESESIESFIESDEKVEWIIKDIIAKNSIGFIVGLPETGKTWLALDLAIEAAKGGKWLGAFGVGRCKTLYIEQERPRVETRRRFKAVLRSKHGTVAGNLQIKSESTIRLDLDQSYQAFRKELDRIRPELVIVDTFVTIHTRDEANKKDIQMVMERIKELRNDFNCAFVFVHHESKMAFQSKEEGKEPSVAEMGGSIGISAAAEWVLTVRKRTDGTSLVYHTKSTMAKAHTPFEVRVTDLDGPEKIEVKGYL